MKQYGLIGKQLGHSWSEKYFTEKFAREGIDAQYRLYETEDVQAWLSTTGKTLDGFNVTIPYKRTILPLLDSIDPVAKEIGAVNVVHVVHEMNGIRFVGYNTDWMGFREAIAPMLTNQPQKAVILGRGGAAKAVRYALKGEVMIWHIEDGEWVNETGTKGIEDAIRTCDILVNATPVGMWPNVEEYPRIPYEAIRQGVVAFDCIYNPLETEFMRRCQAQGAVVQNGLEMLRVQAEGAWEIWKD